MKKGQRPFDHIHVHVGSPIPPEPPRGAIEEAVLFVLPYASFVSIILGIIAIKG